MLITQAINEHGLKILKKNVREVVTSSSPDEKTLLSLIDDSVTGVIIRHNRFTQGMIEKAVNLKVICRHGVGVELIDVRAATERGIPVVNTPHAAVTSVAEHVIMMMLCLAKKFFYADSTFRKGEYAFKNYYEPDDLEGTSLGIIGFGNIGQLVAKRAAAMDMQIYAYDPYADDEIFNSLGVKRIKKLEDLLKISDYITVHTLLNEETRHLIGMKQFRAMKPTAYFINCSRGEVVNELDLIEALQQKLIRGAGLDVFDPEPPMEDNPFFKMDNVILTPHSSSLTTAGMAKMSIHAAEQLLRVLNGQEPEHLVNKSLISKFY